MFKEFAHFLKKFGVVGLAVAVVMGGAVQKMVGAIVADLIMPILGAVSPGGDWRAATLTLGPVKLMVGDLLGAVIDFFFIAMVVFWLTKMVVREDAPAKA